MNKEELDIREVDEFSDFDIIKDCKNIKINALEVQR